MLFLLKKYIANAFFPLPLSVGFLFLGIVLLLVTRKQTAGKIFTVVGFLLLVLFSYRGVSDALLNSLESKYPAVAVHDSALISVSEEFRYLKWIVVLGGGHTDDLRVPLTSQLSPPSLVRLTEGIRLFRLFPGAKLVLSGGSVYDTTSDALLMMQVAVALGVNSQDIAIETDSKDTDDQARLLQPMLRSDKFILVTSASHMPRSMDLFMKLGMHPIPAPTDFLVKDTPGMTPNKLFPTPEALGKSERVMYEYLGELWALLRGKV